MMHAENGIAIDVLVAQALARGRDRPEVPRHDAPVGDRGRGDAPGDHAGQARRRTPLYIVHMSAKQARGDGRRRRATRARTCSARPARSTCTSRSTNTSSAPGFEGAKYVCSTPLRSREEGHQDDAVALPAHRTTCRSSAPTTARSASRSRRSSGSATSRRSPTGSAGSSTAWTSSTRGSSTAQHLAGALGRAVLDHTGAHVRAVSAQGHDRAGRGCRHRRVRPERRQRRSASTPTT